MGYALGNLVFSYRGFTLHLHGGSQIGFGSQVIVIPEAGVGVAVLTNTYGSRLPLALGLTLIDHLLGEYPVPWGSRLSGPPAAPAAVPSPAVDPPGDLQRFEGTFHHPAYGDIGFRVCAGVLTPSFHGLDDDLTFAYAGDDEWRLGATSVPEFQVPVSFTTAADGEVIAVQLRLDAELAPVAFQRR
jgi:hypothetical protein